MILPAGYKWFNGVVLNADHTQAYNTLSAEIQGWVDQVGELHTKVVELKNMRAWWLNTTFLSYAPY